MLIDTHCHLNFKDFKEDADEVIKRTLAAEMQLISIGSQYSTSQRAVEYTNKYEEGVWAAVGIHPVHLFNSASSGDEDFPKKVSLEKFNYDKYLELAKNKKVIAIGEVGLDYHHFNCGKEVNLSNCQKEVNKIIKLQKSVFKEFMKLANEVDKPVVIHGWNADKKDRELVEGAVAYEDILEIIKNNPVKKKGVVHSFIGNYKMAKKFVELGFVIGLNGIITYSESYDRLIREVGLKNIVIETDAPYLTPAPLERYSRNEPMNVKLVAQKIADVLGTDITEVEKVTTKNAKQLFKI
jgi:TatD DNase family protein